jgi:glycosyltransferase involved in cell wall biosynthesis
MKISVVIQTLNSGHVLRSCLEGVKNFDEIVVCDMYSKDDTLQLAKEYGCKIVMHEPCNGIVEPARNFAVNAASHDWVLVVDSDEVVPKELKEYLYAIIESDDCPAGFYIPRKNYLMNKYMRASFPDYQLRFFRKDCFIDWPATIHSRPKIKGNIAKCPKKESLAFIHLEENSISATVSKQNKYSDREVERREDKKESVASLIFKPAHRFFLAYFIKGSFRDGKTGFIYALMRAYNKFITIAKIIENQAEKENKKS